MKPMLAMFLVLALAGSPALADDDDYYADQDRIRAAVERGEALPLERVLAAAARHVPGEVIEVELDEDDGHLLYELKVLSRSGAVRELKLDARTGALLSVEDD